MGTLWLEGHGVPLFCARLYSRPRVGRRRGARVRAGAILQTRTRVRKTCVLKSCQFVIAALSLPLCHCRFVIAALSLPLCHCRFVIASFVIASLSLPLCHCHFVIAVLSLPFCHCQFVIAALSHNLFRQLFYTC